MTSINLQAHLPRNINHQVSQALNEDVGSGDLTAELIDNTSCSEAVVLCRDDAIISGTAWFDEVFNQLNNNVTIKWNFRDGDGANANDTLCTLKGSSRAILTGERTALNFLQTLSATATLTQQYVRQIAHTHCQILDTRKTIPGLRDAQKYAVLCGGGKNHRMGLYDAILIKENHILAAGSIANAVKRSKSSHPNVTVEVEVENLDELKQALLAGADIVMLDNMPADMLINAVDLNQGQAKLEASGGVDLKTIKHLAETGVDYISVGGLTKNISAVDLSMRFI